MALHQDQKAIAGISGMGASDFTGASTIDSYPYLFCSSWTVPPLLGFAYVVLGGLLPRIVEWILASIPNKEAQANSESTSMSLSSQQLRTRALLAVASTAMIIKLSEFLETHPGIFDNVQLLQNDVQPASLSLFVMIVATISQWALLDGSIVALLVATVTAIGGPLAELPFVGHGVWTYIEDAANYFPLQNLGPAISIDSDTLLLQIAQILFGTTDFQDLALSSITGPCYFAVAMDAIALGRWFDTSKSSSSSSLP